MNELQVIRIEINQSLDQINLFQCNLNSIFVLRSTGSVGSPQLTPHHALPHPVEVGVGPLGGGPGGRELDVGGEINFIQLIVYKLSYVPWKIIVSAI